MGHLHIEQQTRSRGAEKVRVTAVAWLGHVQLTLAEWQTYGSRIALVSKSTNWWLGDWLRFGQRRYANGYRHASELTGYDEQTLMNLVYVAGRYGISRRRENLSWSHHAELAALEPPDQDRWLEEAEAASLSVRQLRQRVRDERQGGVQGTARLSPSPNTRDSRTPERVLAVECHHCGCTTYVSVGTMEEALNQYVSSELPT